MVMVNRVSSTKANGGSLDTSREPHELVRFEIAHGNSQVGLRKNPVYADGRSPASLSQINQIGCLGIVADNFVPAEDFRREDLSEFAVRHGGVQPCRG